MFKVVTRNSVYYVEAAPGGFYVTKIADLWGREVKRDRRHFTDVLMLVMGQKMTTCLMTTESPVQAIIPGPRTMKEAK